MRSHIQKAQWPGYLLTLSENFGASLSGMAKPLGPVGVLRSSSYSKATQWSGISVAQRINQSARHLEAGNFCVAMNAGD